MRDDACAVGKASTELDSSSQVSGLTQMRHHRCRWQHSFMLLIYLIFEGVSHPSLNSLYIVNPNYVAHITHENTEYSQMFSIQTATVHIPNPYKEFCKLLIDNT